MNIDKEREAVANVLRELGLTHPEHDTDTVAARITSAVRDARGEPTDTDVSAGQADPNQPAGDTAGTGDADAEPSSNADASAAGAGTAAPDQNSGPQS